MDVTKPYKFLGFGAIDVTKPYRFIGFGAMDVTKPYKFIGFVTRGTSHSSWAPARVYSTASRGQVRPATARPTKQPALRILYATQ